MIPPRLSAPYTVFGSYTASGTYTAFRTYTAFGTYMAQAILAIHFWVYRDTPLIGVCVDFPRPSRLGWWAFCGGLFAGSPTP